MNSDHLVLRVRYDVPEDWDSEKLRDFGLSVQAAVAERLGQILHSVAVEVLAGGGLNQWLDENRVRTTRKDECPGCGIVPAFLPAVEHLPGCPIRDHGRD